MTTRNKLILCILGLVGILLVLSLALALLAPTMLKSELFKSRFKETLQESIGGSIDYRQVELHYFPLPKAELQQVRLFIPDTLAGTVQTLSVYPDLFSLLTGKLRFTGMILDEPNISISLAKKTEKDAVDSSSFSGADLHRTLAVLLAPVATHVPEMKLTINNGTLVLNRQEQPMLAASNLSLKLDFSAVDHSSFTTDIEGQVPELTIFRGTEKVSISGKGLKASLRADQGKVIAELTELTLIQPQLALTGTFTAAQNDIALEVRGQNIDVDATRKTALALLGEFPVTRAIFHIVRGGIVPHISFFSRGIKLGELGELDNMLIKGRLQDGKIFAPAVDLPLEKTNGDIVIAAGILNGKDLSTRLEGSTGEQGQLRIGLRGGDAPFHLDLLIDADLAQLIPILERVVANQAFVAELKRISMLKGRGRGKLVLGETLGAVEARIDVEELNLTTDYQRIPFPVAISQGQFTFGESQVGLANLAGSVGKSNFSDLSYSFQWQEALTLDITSGRFDLELEELFPWAVSFADVRELLAELEDATGQLRISDLQLKGPVNKPKQWRFEVAGLIKELTLQTSYRPEPVQLSGGSFSLKPHALTLRNVQGRALDAALDLSGELRGIDSGELMLSGTLGSETTEWLRNTLSLGPIWAVHVPLTLSQGELTWQPQATYSFQGEIAFPEGAKVAGAVHYSAEKFLVPQLTIESKDSFATLSLGYFGDSINLEFLGSVDKNLLGKIFVAPQFSDNWLNGDFKAVLSQNHLEKSSFRGKLSAGNIIFPLQEQEPLHIEDVDVSAQGNRIDISSLALNWGQHSATLKGAVAVEPEGYLLDLAVATGELQWHDIDQFLVAEKEMDAVERDKHLWEMPVSGDVRLSADSFNMRHFTWKPVQADISISPDTVDIKVNQAYLCGISTPGTVTINQAGLMLDFQPSATDQQLASSYPCLTQGRIEMTGTFDLASRIEAQGQADSLLKSSTGYVSFKARKGEITRHKLFSRILEIINVTEIYKGKFPSLDREGFPYDAVTAKGHLKDGKYHLNEFFLDGETMEVVGKGEIDLENKSIDLKMLVEPLKTVDSLIKIIPGLDYLLAGSLISIPVSVTGDLSAPLVSILSPSDVGSGLLRLVERILKAPLKLIEPIIPSTGTSDSEE